MSSRQPVASGRVTSQRLRGVIPPIPTPFDDKGRVCYNALSENIPVWNQTPTTGYLVLGSNGEYPLLEADEQVDLVRRVKMLCDGKILMAGSGRESTQGTINISNRMADVGADCVLVINPFYYKSQMTSSALIKHFESVANHSVIPIVLYNMPGNSGLDIPIDVVVHMARHPNCIGLKDSGSDITRISRICNMTSHIEFSVMCGSASILQCSYMAGCTGAISALANILGQEVCQLYAYCEKADWVNASELQKRLVEPNTVLAQCGVSGLKGTLDWIGFYGGPVRPPLEEISQTKMALLRQTFVSSGFYINRDY